MNLKGVPCSQFVLIEAENTIKKVIEFCGQ